MLLPGSGFAGPVAVGCAVVAAGSAVAVAARRPIGRGVRALCSKLLGGRFGGEAKLDELQAEMAQRLAAEHRVIADAVHSPAVEQPEETAAALLAFLDTAGR